MQDKIRATNNTVLKEARSMGAYTHPLRELRLLSAVALEKGRATRIELATYHRTYLSCPRSYEANATLGILTAAQDKGSQRFYTFS